MSSVTEDGVDDMPVMITTFIGQYTVPELIAINNIIVISRPFYVTVSVNMVTNKLMK